MPVLIFRFIKRGRKIQQSAEAIQLNQIQVLNQELKNWILYHFYFLVRNTPDSRLVYSIDIMKTVQYFQMGRFFCVFLFLWHPQFLYAPL